jgi:hypothetical protein
MDPYRENLHAEEVKAPPAKVVWLNPISRSLVRSGAFMVCFTVGYTLSMILQRVGGWVRDPAPWWGIGLVFGVGLLGTFLLVGLAMHVEVKIHGSRR